MQRASQTDGLGGVAAALRRCGVGLLALSLVPLISGCGGSSRALEAAAGLVAGISEGAAPDQLTRGVRTDYPYIDEVGSVRFVSSLLEVPERWRDRAGRVELASAPPLRPADRTAELERRRERARAVVAASVPARSNLDVQLYYASWCGFCRKAKAHLDDRGVDYVLRNVDDPDTQAELVARTGSRSIPVLDVGGEFVRGYNAAAIDRLLEKL